MNLYQKNSIMKQILSIIACGFLLLTPAALKAQEAVGGPQSQYPVLTNKLEKSDEAVTNEKKNATAKFWLQRGDLLLDIWDVHMQYLAVGTSQAQLTLLFGKAPSIETVQKDGQVYENHMYERITITYKNGVVDSWEETNKIHENPLPEAWKAFQKALELDVDHKLDKKISESLLRLKDMLDREAVSNFVKEDFNKSLECFEIILAINATPSFEGTVDTIIYYNAGMAASKADLNEKSIEYYELARKYNHPDANLYVFLKNKYIEMGDTATAIERLVEGFNKYPDAQSIIVDLINFYLVRNEADKALEYLQIAQKDQPDNISFIFAEGTLWDKSGEFDKAIAAYQRCLDYDDTYFNAYYNMGVVYYNKAAKEYDVCNSILDNKKYDACKIEADKTLQKAVPYMEKAKELQPNDKSVYETLKTIYYRLQMTDKYNEVVEKLKTL